MNSSRAPKAAQIKTRATPTVGDAQGNVDRKRNRESWLLARWPAALTSRLEG